MHGQKSKIFKRLKNREDGSKFDDFWTKSIAAMKTIISKICLGRFLGKTAQKLSFSKIFLGRFGRKTGEKLRESIVEGTNDERDERRIRRTTKNFKRLKNREDGSDLDENLTESIAATQSIIAKNNRAVFVRRLRKK